jgi:AcrR family transcriptional regulator
VADGSHERRRPGRPTGAEGSVTRARLLRAARERFSDQGYERATPASIGAAAGVGRTAVHHYFGSKADLYRAVIEDVNASVLEHLFGEEPRTIADPVERIEWVFRESARLNAEDPSYGRFLATMLVDGFRYPEFATLAATGVERTRSFFVDAAGERDADLLVAVQWGLGLFAAFIGDAARVRAAVDRLVELIDTRVD